jgi:hypothetical protein
MRLKFKGHSKTEREINFDPIDFEIVEKVMLAYFLERMKFLSLDSSYSKEDRTLVKLCEKYGVDPHYVPDRLAFFKAILEEA